MQKPHAISGTYCPFWRKDVSKVCHLCELWEPLPVSVTNADGLASPRELWACTIKHQTFVLRDLLRSIDGLQKAEESFRNTAWNESQENLRDIVETVRHQNRFNENLGSALTEIVRSPAHRMIEGS